MSNLINLLAYALPIVIGLITGQNGTETYVWWCKLMNYLGNILFALSIITLCLASIDRYHSTSRSVQRRQRSSMKVAIISISVAIIVSLLLGIADLLYWEIDNSYGVPLCIVLSPSYYLYTTYFLAPVIYTSGPVTLLSVFGILTYYNIKSVRHVNSVRTNNAPNLITAAFTVSRISVVPNNDENTHVHLGQDQIQKKKITDNKQRIDRQFSTILILQILYFAVTTVPACVNYIYKRATINYEKSDMTQAIEGLVTAITWMISCTPFCSNFYIYYLSSSTYRKNVKKMLCTRREIRIRPTNAV